jgi:hypothetical protein
MGTRTDTVLRVQVMLNYIKFGPTGTATRKAERRLNLWDAST